MIFAEIERNQVSTLMSVANYVIWDRTQLMSIANGINWDGTQPGINRDVRC